MAQTMVSTQVEVGFVNVRRAKAGSVIGNGNDIATIANYSSIGSLDTRLAAISSTIYTQSILDKMTLNDKIYAVRMNDDLTTAK